MTTSPIAVLTVAGGNPTAIVKVDRQYPRQWYAQTGAALRQRTTERLRASKGPLSAFEAEQAGFLFADEAHFEMSGGELCGNAVLSAAFLQSRYARSQSFSLSTSGLEHPVSIETVTPTGAQSAKVTGVFSQLPSTVQEFGSARDRVSVVDLGGIVHVVISGRAPADRSTIETRHTELRSRLGLEQRSAVGVIWTEAISNEAHIVPVVWVRGDPSDPSTSSFCFETACGSGSMAAALVSGVHRIVQPTGQILDIRWAQNRTRVQAEVEIVLTTG